MPGVPKVLHSIIAALLVPLFEYLKRKGIDTGMDNAAIVDAVFTLAQAGALFAAALLPGIKGAIANVPPTITSELERTWRGEPITPEEFELAMSLIAATRTNPTPKEAKTP